MKHMFQSREMNRKVRNSLDLPELQRRDKVLWFTDTINHPNVISQTLQEVGWQAFRNGNRIRLVTAAAPNEAHTALPPNVLYLPIFFSLDLPSEFSARMHFPSVLRALKIIHNEDPGEIVISTPGPMGLLGLLSAKLLNIKCTGIYHTDLTQELMRFSGDLTPTELVETYTHWFYSEMDWVKVSTPEYMDLLEQKGLERTKLSLLPEALDAVPQAGAEQLTSPEFISSPREPLDRMNHQP